MKRIALALITIFILLPLIVFPAIAQEAFPIKDTAIIIVGDGSSGGGSEPPPAECTTSIAQCLNDEFNVTLRGSYTFAEQRDIYEHLSQAGRSTKYRNLLKTSGPLIFNFVNDPDKGGGCPGVVSGNTLTLYNYTLSGCPDQDRLSRIVHETGHLIRNGHDKLFQLWIGQGYNKDSDCYYKDDPSYGYYRPYFINTYSTVFAHQLNDQGYDVSPQGENESMADFMALTLVPDGQYPQKCPVGWNWVKQYIFGNYPF